MGYHRRRNKSLTTGTIFSVARILKRMRKCGLLRTRRFRRTSAVYIAAVIEYLMREIADLAGDVTHQHKRKIITPRHIMLAVLTDSELSICFKHVTFPFSGVIPQPVAAQISPTCQTGKRVSLRSINPDAVAKTSKAKPKTSQPALSILSERLITNRTMLSVVSANLATVKATVALHPTSSDISFHGMVGSALLSAAGQNLQAIIDLNITEHGPIDSSNVRLTPSCNLPFPWIMHCVSPSWNSSDAAGCVKKLTDLITTCFEICDNKSLSAVAIPSISSGRNGFPKQLAAQTILRAIKTYCDSHSHNTNISDVKFVLYDQESVQIYRTEMHRLA